MTYLATTDKVRLAYVLARVEGGGLSWDDATVEFNTWLEDLEGNSFEDGFHAERTTD